ncbi:MAG: DMT family transporter [Pseudomonadota bacterium]
MASALKHALGPLAIGACAVALGVSIDVYVKYLALQAPLLYVVGLRFLFGGLLAVGVFLLPVRAKNGQRRRLPDRKGCVFHTLRALLQLSTAYLFFYGVTILPLATATTLGFSAALMLPFIAWAILKEPPTATAVFATIIGFFGTALAAFGGAQNASTTEPETYALGVICCLLAAFIYAVILVMLRLRAGQEDAATMSVFTSLVPGVILLPVMLQGDGLAILTSMAAQGLVAHTIVLSAIAYAVWFLMSLAYARAPAQQLAPLEYTALIWSASAGFLVFGERPSWQIWLGAAVVIVACLTVAAERHLTARKMAKLPASTLPD